MNRNFTFKLNLDLIEKVKNITGTRSIEVWLEDAIQQKLDLIPKDCGGEIDRPYIN